VYALQRVAASGKIFETVISLSNYPSEITLNPGKGCTYGVWFKQE